MFDVLWRVSVSTVPTWDEYVSWERALLSDAFQQSPEMHELALKLTRDAKTPREKLDKLLAYTQQEIRYQMDYETTIAGVKPHSCRAVLERGYGDCKDKAVLLTSLAREVGIELHFAILRTTTVGKVETKVPNQQFNHAIVYVPKQEGFPEGFFIDPTTDGLDIGNLRGDDQGALSLVIDPKGNGFEFIAIPYQAPELQYDNHEILMKVTGPEKVVATDKITMRGGNAESVRRVLRNRAYSEKFFEQLEERPLHRLDGDGQFGGWNGGHFHAAEPERDGRRLELTVGGERAVPLAHAEHVQHRVHCAGGPQAAIAARAVQHEQLPHRCGAAQEATGSRARRVTSASRITACSSSGTPPSRGSACGWIWGSPAAARRSPPRTIRRSARRCFERQVCCRMSWSSADRRRKRSVAKWRG